MLVSCISKKMYECTAETHVSKKKYNLCHNKKEIWSSTNYFKTKIKWTATCHITSFYYLFNKNKVKTQKLSTCLDFISFIAEEFCPTLSTTLLQFRHLFLHRSLEVPPQHFNQAEDRTLVDYKTLILFSFSNSKQQTRHSFLLCLGSLYAPVWAKL